MSLTLNDFSVSPKTVKKSNNDVTITLKYKAKVSQASDNPVKMKAMIIEQDVSFVDGGTLKKSCSWDENFTTTSKEYTKALVVRVLKAPPVISICDIKLIGKTTANHSDECDSSFNFSK
jgi:hypothetical protein